MNTKRIIIGFQTDEILGGGKMNEKAHHDPETRRLRFQLRLYLNRENLNINFDKFECIFENKHV